MQYYERAIALEPQDPSLHERLGTTLWDFGKAEAAIQAYQKSISIDPSRPGPHSKLGYAYLREGRRRDAKDQYETALRYGATDLASLETLCSVYHWLGEFEHAADCLRRVLSLDPNNIPARHLYSYTLRNLRGKAPQ